MFRRVLSGSFLIAGTTVGGGMLGIPLLTAVAGFWPAVMITIFAWALLLYTGFLFLEATLWMPRGSNLLSTSERFLGKGGRWFAGIMFLFLYYCLLVAYYAVGAPMLALALNLPPLTSYLLFGLLFGGIVALGSQWIDRVNLILTAALILSYCLLVGTGVGQVQSEAILTAQWPLAIFALPVLFAAFGFHNIIPSLITYFGKELKPLKLSLIFGTLISLVVYILWQYLVIGIVPLEKVREALNAGLPVTAVLREATGSDWLFRFGQAFAFFAVVTSLLGVSFSFVDFLADGLKMGRTGWRRVLLTLLTFFPPFLFVITHPAVFDKALGLAGGIGEAILNGLVPIALVWVGSRSHGLKGSGWTKRPLLVGAAAITLAVMVIELITLLS